MTLEIIENRKIRSNKKYFDNFLEKFHDVKKNFKIDCEAINVDDYFSSETPVIIRHRKPAKDSIYYAEVFKESNETAYFFGLARDNVIATSNYLSQESHIVPILAATLHLEESSKSNLVFASDSKEFNNVILLRIDCNELNDTELDVLKNKNKITKLTDGKGFINFGPIGDFNTLKNIRNFISNVKFENDNELYVKIVEVSVPENYSSLKPDSNIVKDRFYNFNNFNSLDDDSEDVIDLNESETVDEESIDSDIIEFESLNEEKDNIIELKKLDDGPEIIDFESLHKEGTTNLDSDLYKYFLFDNDDLFIEMSIDKSDFFKNMEIFNNFKETYLSDLDYIEVLDMGDELLNITLIFLIGVGEDIEIIKEFLNLNNFVEKV